MVVGKPMQFTVSQSQLIYILKFNSWQNVNIVSYLSPMLCYIMFNVSHGLSVLSSLKSIP